VSHIEGRHRHHQTCPRTCRRGAWLQWRCDGSITSQSTPDRVAFFADRRV